MKEDNTIKQFFTDVGFIKPFDNYDFFANESGDTNDDYYYHDEDPRTNADEFMDDIEDVMDEVLDGALRINGEVIDDDSIRDLGMIKIGTNPLSDTLGHTDQASNKNLDYSAGKNPEVTHSFSDSENADFLQKPGAFPKKSSGVKQVVPMNGIVLENNTMINGKIYEKGSIIKLKRKKIWSK